MTPVNMAKHRNNPNMPFWKMIKEGYDHFEVTRQEPKVDFCEKKYVFDAAKAPNATRDPVFDASAKCPAYVIPDEIADAVREKQQEDAGRNRQADRKGNAGRANQHRHRWRHEQDVRRRAYPTATPDCPKAATARACRCCPCRARPAPFPPTSIRRARPPTICCSARRKNRRSLVAPQLRPPDPTRVANAAPNAQSDGFFSSLARKVGFGGSCRHHREHPAARQSRR